MKHQLPHELVTLFQAFNPGNAGVGDFDMEKIIQGYVEDIGNHHTDDARMADEQDVLARMAVEDFIPRGDDAMVEITQTLGIFGPVIHRVAIEALEQAGVVAGNFIAGLALPCPKA